MTISNQQESSCIVHSVLIRCSLLSFILMSVVVISSTFLRMDKIRQHQSVIKNLVFERSKRHHHNSHFFPQFTFISRRLMEQKFSGSAILNKSEMVTTSTVAVNISTLSDFGIRMFQNERAIGYFDFIVPQMSVPRGENVYLSFCINMQNITKEIKVINPDLTPNPLKKIVIVGFEPYINRHNLVHHYDLIASKLDLYHPSERNFERYKCNNGSFPSLPNEKSVWIWERDIGTPPQAVRDRLFAGSYVFGVSSATRTLRLKIHYMNGALTPYLLDRTGVRIYFNYSYTNTCPKKDRCEKSISFLDFVWSLFGRKQSSYIMSSPYSSNGCRESCVKQTEVIKRKEMKEVCGNRC
jgi:hypothetical protein